MLTFFRYSRNILPSPLQSRQTRLSLFRYSETKFLIAVEEAKKNIFHRAKWIKLKIVVHEDTSRCLTLPVAFFKNFKTLTFLFSPFVLSRNLSNNWKFVYSLVYKITLKSYERAKYRKNKKKKITGTKFVNSVD